MIHVYGFDSGALDALCPTYSQSPEDFLADLEQQLEDGDITEEEAVQLIKDFTSRSRTRHAIPSAHQHSQVGSSLSASWVSVWLV